MNNKFLVFVLSFVLVSCGPLKVEQPDLISLKMINGIENNKGNLIVLNIKSQNFPFFGKWFERNKEMCEKQTMLAFTFSTPRKKPKEWILLKKDDFQLVKTSKNGIRKVVGRYRAEKSDIYLMHNGKKISPNRIFIADNNFDAIKSRTFNLAYSNYSRHSTQFLTFPIPCTSVISTPESSPKTKLIISKIYKDDKVIKENLEFEFIKSKKNKIYGIWLE